VEQHAYAPVHRERVVEAVVVFADVSGYTTLAEACNNPAAAGGPANLVGSASMGLAGAERMRDALNEYLGNMIDLMTDHGADIVKFAGDAVMAMWEVKRTGSSPESASETALRATAVCLEMSTMLDEYSCRGLPKGYGGDKEA
jgi:class 3 adenylate cyclase